MICDCHFHFCFSGVILVMFVDRSKCQWTTSQFRFPGCILYTHCCCLDCSGGQRYHAVPSRSKYKPVGIYKQNTMTGIHPKARSQTDLSPGLGLPTYSGCLGQWWKALLEEGGSGFTPSGVQYGRGADLRLMLVLVNNFSHYFCLPVCPSVCDCPFCFSWIPLSAPLSPYWNSSDKSWYWYLKLWVLVNASEILQLCKCPCFK